MFVLPAEDKIDYMLGSYYGEGDGVFEKFSK
jgi:hypothetical protein